VHRIGFAPDPWRWTPWEFATDGRFDGRWDDPDGIWRVVYAGQDRETCYLEVLAAFRLDRALQEDLAAIVEDPADAREHPTLESGLVPLSWLAPRQVGAAQLDGWYAVPGDKVSLPTLRQRFLALAIRLQLPDLDAAAVRIAEPRTLTQAVAGWIYQHDDPTGSPLAGIEFQSRHGDDLVLWAIFERTPGGARASCLANVSSSAIRRDDPALVRAMRLHRLAWAT
jgi:hypothetical protein